MPDQEEFLADFRTESLEALGEIQTQILCLEEGSSDALGRVFRAMHSMKGGASFLSLTRINRLAHCLENLLEQIRAHKRQVTQVLIDLLLQGADRLETMVRQEDAGESTDIDDLLQAIQHLPEAEHTGAFRPKQGDSCRWRRPAPSGLGPVEAKLAKDPPFGTWLVESGILGPEQVLRALQEQEREEAPALIHMHDCGLDAHELLRIANLAWHEGLHPFQVALQLNLIDIQAYQLLMARRQECRPPLGSILVRLNLISASALREHLANYFAQRQGLLPARSQAQNKPGLPQEQAPKAKPSGLGHDDDLDTQQHRPNTDRIRESALEERELNPIEIPAEAPNDLPLTRAIGNEGPKWEFPPINAIQADEALLEEFAGFYNPDLQQELEQGLLALEQGLANNEHSLRHLYRQLHSLKGSAGFLGAALLQSLIHAIEEMIAGVQRLGEVDSSLRSRIASTGLIGLDLCWLGRSHVLEHQQEHTFAEEAADRLQLYASEVGACLSSLAQATPEPKDLEDRF